MDYRNPPSVGAQSFVSDTSYAPSLLSPASHLDATDTDIASRFCSMANPKRQRKLSASKSVKRLQPYPTQCTPRNRRLAAATRDAQRVYNENPGKLLFNLFHTVVCNTHLF